MMLDQLVLTPLSVYFGDWKDNFDKIRVVRSAPLKGTDHWLVHLTRKSLPVTILYINQETGDISRADTTMITTLGTQLPMTTYLSDYREVNGLRLPFHVRTESDETGAIVFEYKNSESNVEVPNSLFEPRK